MEHKGTQTIITERLILRSFCLEDTEMFHKHIGNDKKVQEYFLMAFSETEEQTREFIADLVGKYDERKYWWAIELKDSHEVIGQILGINARDYFFNIEIGYSIGQLYWNKGYTTEALKAVIDFLHEVGYHRIVCAFITENLASKRVMEKAGMEYEGIRKDEIFYRNQFFDVGYMYHIKGEVDEKKA